jgi:hypothetical protein
MLFEIDNAARRSWSQLVAPIAWLAKEGVARQLIDPLPDLREKPPQGVCGGRRSTLKQPQNDLEDHSPRT